MKGVDTSSHGNIGHYRLLRVLGEGGMGVVHLAEDPEGRRVAIKVLRPQVAADRTALRRLAREVDTMRRVRSPYVAEILDADVTATQPYIVTQFVPGRTLEEQVLDGGPLPPRLLLRVATGLAQALAAIHGAGVIHRDLKPGNVMLVEGQPVLIDFGIAQGMDASRLTATGMVIGTPGYLAPEIIDGEEAGPPADIHAWAATLIFAATGRPPFGSGTFESIFYKIMNGTPDMDGVPGPLLPLIRAAMARHPVERPTAVNLVQLARKIDMDTTLTDRTRTDTPANAFLIDVPTTKDHAARIEAIPPADDGTVVDSPTAPQPVRDAYAPPQPKDFKGQLPPVAPPPAQPRQGPRPYVPPKQRPYVPGQQQYGGYVSAPPQAPPQRGYPPQQPPYGGYGQPPTGQPPTGQPPTGQVRPPGTGEAPKPEKRKPYFAYRLCSLAVLGIMLGLTARMPIVMLGVALVGAVVLRAADKAAKGMESKRVRRGPGAGDVIAAFLKTPLHLPGAILKTAMWGGVWLFGGVVLVGMLMGANANMAAGKAIAYGTMAVVALLCAGPGSGGARRQAARVWGAFLPRIEPALVVLVLLGIVAAVLLVGAKGYTPSLKPLTVDAHQSLNDLENSIRSWFNL